MIQDLYHFSPAVSKVRKTYCDAANSIPGFMGAMTMGYPVNPPSLLHKLKAGDAVRFTIDTKQKAIIGIEHLKQ